MKETVKNYALLGLVGIPVLIITSTISMGIINGVAKSIQKRKMIINK